MKKIDNNCPIYPVMYVIIKTHKSIVLLYSCSLCLVYNTIDIRLT